jgi:hypothetical protein
VCSTLAVLAGCRVEADSTGARLHADPAGALAAAPSARAIPPGAMASGKADAPAAPRRPARLIDPLAPNRPLERVDGTLAENWRRERAAGDRQYMRSPRERGGVIPCEAPDPGPGVHTDWIHVRPMGQFIAPRTGALAADGGFDLVVHFHGHRPARKELVRTGEDLVLLGVSLGPGADYRKGFADETLLETLVAGTERALGAREGRTAHVRRLALSSWSRGYDAIALSLARPIAARVDALVLLDSLHASRNQASKQAQLAPFVEFARRAAGGEKFMVVTHSAIETDGYASTTETAHTLIQALGGEPEPVFRRDPLGLELFEIYSQRDFHARGYAGNGKLDHCAQFGAYPDAMRALARRWASGT